MGKSKELFMTTYELVDVSENQLLNNLNREALNNEVLKIESAVKQGFINPLDGFLFLKFMEEVAKKAKDSLNELAQQQAALHSTKQFEYKGAKIQVKAAAGRYNYAHIERWAELKEEMKKIEEMAQAACKANAPAMITPDGETVPAAKYTAGKETIAISFK